MTRTSSSDEQSGFMERLREKPELFVAVISIVVALIVGGMFQVGEAFVSGRTDDAGVSRTLSIVKADLDAMEKRQDDMRSELAALSTNVEDLRSQSTRPAQNGWSARLDTLDAQIRDVAATVETLEQQISPSQGEPSPQTERSPFDAINSEAFISKVLRTIGSSGARLAKWELERANAAEFADAFSIAETRLIARLNEGFAGFDQDASGRIEAAEIDAAKSGQSDARY